MPSIKDQSTVEAIARAFTSNGRIKSIALESVGYKERYSRTCGLKLYDNIRVKEAISRIDAKLATEQGWTVERSQSLALDAYDLAMKQNQPSAAVSAVTTINRLHGMDKDNDQRHTDTPEEITPEQRTALLEYSRELQRIKGIKLTTDKEEVA